MNSFKVFLESSKLKHARSVDEIAKKHGISTTQVSAALSSGIAVEREHTNDRNTAMIIASHHLYERPDYYKRLKKVE